jgi:hypothetical protein
MLMQNNKKDTNTFPPDFYSLEIILCSTKEIDSISDSPGLKVYLRKINMITNPMPEPWQKI